MRSEFPHNLAMPLAFSLAIHILILLSVGRPVTMNKEPSHETFSVMLFKEPLEQIRKPDSASTLGEGSGVTPKVTAVQHDGEIHARKTDLSKSAPQSVGTAFESESSVLKKNKTAMSSLSARNIREEKEGISAESKVALHPGKENFKENIRHDFSKENQGENSAGIQDLIPGHRENTLKTGKEENILARENIPLEMEKPPASRTLKKGDPKSGSAGAPEDQMASFLAMVRGKIEKAKFYPPAAKRRGYESKVKVKFAILPDGRVVDLEMTESSTRAVLNYAALQAIEKAAPFQPFPQGQADEGVKVLIDIVYKLE